MDAIERAMNGPDMEQLLSKPADRCTERHEERVEAPPIDNTDGLVIPDSTRALPDITALLAIEANPPILRFDPTDKELPVRAVDETLI